MLVSIRCNSCSQEDPNLRTRILYFDPLEFGYFLSERPDVQESSGPEGGYMLFDYPPWPVMYSRLLSMAEPTDLSHALNVSNSQCPAFGFPVLHRFFFGNRTFFAIYLCSSWSFQAFFRLQFLDRRTLPLFTPQHTTLIFYTETSKTLWHVNGQAHALVRYN